VTEEETVITDTKQGGGYFDNRDYIALLFITLIGILLQIIYSASTSDLFEIEDIYYVWLEGDRLASGNNPYEYILDGNLVVNEKYASYLPFYYLLGAFIQSLGFTTFGNWIVFFKFFSGIFFLLIAYTLFLVFRNKSFGFALFASAYWIFNHWTIYVIYVVHIDFAPVFFLLISLLYLDKKENLSLFSLGLSLSMKHLAMFLIPLYLIHIYKKNDSHDLRSLYSPAIKIISIPTALSMPFLIWNFKGFMLSMIFSGTRLQEEAYDQISSHIDSDFVFIVGIIARLGMFTLMLVVYRFYIADKIGTFLTAFLIITMFIEFNVFTFEQYNVWRAAILPLALFEIIYGKDSLEL
jgi:Gpi18-like mannosyltransferase